MGLLSFERVKKKKRERDRLVFSLLSNLSTQSRLKGFPEQRLFRRFSGGKGLKKAKRKGYFIHVKHTNLERKVNGSHWGKTWILPF